MSNDKRLLAGGLYESVPSNTAELLLSVIDARLASLRAEIADGQEADDIADQIAHFEATRQAAIKARDRDAQRAAFDLETTAAIMDCLAFDKRYKQWLDSKRWQRRLGRHGWNLFARDRTGAGSHEEGTGAHGRKRRRRIAIEFHIRNIRGTGGPDPAGRQHRQRDRWRKDRRDLEG